jgi:DNA-binding transcriptional LysR family regulator
MHDVDTALLRTFVTLAETASFSRTATRVGRSQSAVSGQIARLETAFGRRSSSATPATCASLPTASGSSCTPGR